MHLNPNILDDVDDPERINEEDEEIEYDNRLPYLYLEYGETDIMETESTTLESHKSTCLHFAAERGFSDIVELLIKKNFHIDARRQDNTTPLFLACREGHIDVVKILLDKNANPEIKVKSKNPIIIAHEKGEWKILKILNRNCNINNNEDYLENLKQKQKKRKRN